MSDDADLIPKLGLKWPWPLQYPRVRQAVLNLAVWLLLLYLVLIVASMAGIMVAMFRRLW